MANQWFRLYAEFATDPKVQMMSEANQRRFIMLLCLRCSNDDVTLHDEEVAFQLRISVEEWEKTKALFVSKGLLNEDNTPTAWDKRQFVSDSSAERVRRHREAKKKAAISSCNACNVTETPPDTDTDTDKPFVNQRQQSETEEACETPTAAAAADPVAGRAIELTALLRRRGADLQASDPRVRGWASSGVTDAQALAALERAQEQRAARGSPQPINAGLLSAILTDITTQTEGPNHGQPRRPSAADRRAAVVAELTGANRRAAQDQHDPHARTLDGQARVVR